MTDVEQGGTPEQKPADSGAIDWTKIDLTTVPEDVIKSHPLYKGVLDESINRRKEIATLKANQPADKTTETPKEPVTELDKVMAQLNKVNEFITEVSKDRDLGVRKSAAKTAGIPEEFASRLSGTNYDEYLADAQALKPLVGTTGNNKITDNSSPTNPANSGERDKSMFNQMKARMNGQASVNPFSPGFQKQAGGGPIDFEPKE